MVAHLIYWKKGKLIKSLSQHSVFIINPRMKEKKSDLYSNYLLSLDQSFSHSFFNFRLAEILRDFSTPLTLVTHVHKLAANKQKDFLNVVMWLLRHDLIIELNTYFYLNIPLEVEINVREKEREREREKERIERSKKRLALPENGSVPKTPLISNVVVLDDEEEGTSASNTGKASVDDGSHRASNGFVKSKPSSSAADATSAEAYPSAPQPLQPHEAAYLDRLNDGGMIYKLFLRLCPLFRGHHHAEEILWRMGITRDDLQKVLHPPREVGPLDEVSMLTVVCGGHVRCWTNTTTLLYLACMRHQRVASYKRSLAHLQTKEHSWHSKLPKRT